MDNKKTKIFINGKVRIGKFGETKLSIHEDSIKHFKNGWLNIDIKEKRDGGHYMELNTWEPSTTPGTKHANLTPLPLENKKIITTQGDLPITPNNPNDDLPF